MLSSFCAVALFTVIYLGPGPFFVEPYVALAQSDIKTRAHGSHVMNSFIWFWAPNITFTELEVELSLS